MKKLTLVLIFLSGCDTHKLLLNNMKFYKKHGYCWTVATHGYWGAISIAPPELCELNPEMSNR